MSGLARITYQTTANDKKSAGKITSGNLSTAILPFNPLLKSQRLYHEVLMEFTVFIEKTIVIAPSLKEAMMVEYVKAAHDYYKTSFKYLFRELISSAKYKKVILNFELADRCPLDLAMKFNVPVRFQQTVNKVKKL